VPGLHTGCPREENAAAAEGLLEEVRRRLRSEPSGDLAHRSEQRQPAVVGLDGLVGDCGDTAVRKRPCKRLVGGDVEVREEDEPLAEARVLGLDRLLDLEEEVGLPPRVVDRNDARTGALVLRVVEGASVAGGRLTTSWPRYSSRARRVDTPVRLDSSGRRSQSRRHYSAATKPRPSWNWRLGGTVLVVGVRCAFADKDEPE
jgi:hypothetical protein